MEESRRQAAIKLGLTPDQLKGLEAQATKPGQQASDKRPIVPAAEALPEGDTGRYRWRQTPSELEIVVPIDANVRARDVAWSISHSHITVGVKGREALRNARLRHDVKLGGGHSWQLDADRGERCILVTLEKKHLHDKWLAIEADPSDPAGASMVVEVADTSSGPAVKAVRSDVVSQPAVCAGHAGPSEPSGSSAAEQELASVEKELRNVQSQLDDLRCKEQRLKSRQEELKAVIAGSTSP